MNTPDVIKRQRLKESIKSQCEGSLEDKMDRYLEIEHQGIISGHYFAAASSECIYLYRDGYFIGAVMMSHAINEAIIKFITERNGIERSTSDGTTKTIEELIEELKEKKILSSPSAEASLSIWKSFRADIHHMNPTVAKLDFRLLAQQNLKFLSLIEREIFDVKFNNGAIVPTHPQYWDIKADGTTTAFLRLQ
jgi:hypothetical protein